MPNTPGAVWQFIARVWPFILMGVSGVMLLFSVREWLFEQFFRCLVWIVPLDAQAHLLLGERLMEEQPQEAEVQIRQALALQPHLIRAYHALAHLQLSIQDQPAEAEHTVARLLKLFPDYALGYWHQGKVFETQERFKDAERAYRKCAWLAPDFPWGYSALGGLFAYKTRNFGAAERAYRQAIENDPDRRSHYYHLGIVLAHMQRWEDARECFQKVIAKHPKFGTAYACLGHMLLQADRREEAGRIASKAMKLRMPSAWAEYTFASLLDQLGRFSEAESAYRQCIDKDSKYIPAYNSLALLLELQPNRSAESEQVFRRGLEIDPTDLYLNYNLSFLLRSVHREEEAIPFIRQALLADPDDFDCYVSLAAIGKGCGDQQALQENAEKARSLAPTDDDYRLAGLESVCANRELAFEHLRKAAQQKDFEAAWAWRDPDLQFVRDDPRFAEIVGSEPEPSNTKDSTGTQP